MRRVYELNTPAAVSLWFERSVTPAWGLVGGQSGAPPDVAVNPGRQDERHLLKANSMTLEAGDVVEVRTGGGGGFGPALERDPDLVLRDVLDGHVTRNGANRDYGVVVAPDGSIDEEATRRVRSTWRATI